MNPQPRSEKTVQNMIALLKDPAFRSLRTLVGERPLPWTEFKNVQIPEGITQEQTWDLLNVLRRQTAVELPFRDGDGRCGWYYPTRSILDDLEDIDRRCHEGSWLDLVIKSRNTTYYLVEAHVDEAIANIKEDGLSIGYEKAREVLLGERGPENSDERLLLNGHQVIWDLDAYVEKPCTPDTIWELYETVSKGVDPQVTAPAVQRSPIWKKARMGSDTTLSLVASLVNGNREGQAEHPLLLGMAIRHLFMSTFPLPAWNGTMNSLMMKLLFMKSRLPALSFVPIVKTCQEWETGVIRPPAVMTTVADSEVLIDGEVDYTIYVGIIAKLVRRKLDEVEDDLKRALKRDAGFMQTLHDKVDINHRQQAVLQIALSNPRAVFRIESHRKTHRVAYATARADLMKLVDLGFLGCVRTKRAFEFPVAPGLRQLLGEVR